MALDLELQYKNLRDGINTEAHQMQGKWEKSAYSSPHPAHATPPQGPKQFSLWPNQP